MTQITANELLQEIRDLKDITSIIRHLATYLAHLR
jgi:hypothetical protein